MSQLLDRQAIEPASNMEIATTRQAQEVQAAMTVAKKYPRDEQAAIRRIKTACARKGLAEQSAYTYPRGGTKVTGPSIRLAEALASAWGNIDFGIIELDQSRGESSVMAYAWDLETNVRQTKVFTVRHERHTNSGAKALSDPRDIYELIANNGARRMRACILGIIPGDIQDMAIEECDKTLKGENSEPLVDRLRKMIEAFSTFSVTAKMIEVRLGYSLDAVDERALVDLRKIYTSLKDGMSKREDWFKVGDSGKKKSLDEVTTEIGGDPVNQRDAYLAQIQAATTKDAVESILKLAVDDTTLTEEEMQEVLTAGNDRKAALSGEKKADGGKAQKDLV